MRERSWLPLCVVALLSASILGLVPASRQAVPTPTASPVRTPSADLKVQDVDVREAIRTVFKAFPSQLYTISSEVQGKVTADFRGLVLDDALSVLLRQVDAAVKIESGVYIVVPRSELSRIVILDGPTPGKLYALDRNPAPSLSEPPVVTSDASFLYVLRQGVVHKIDKATLKVVGKADLNDRRIRIQY